MKITLATVCAAVLLSAAATAARPSVALLIAEDGLDGKARIWWNCAKNRPDLPMTDVLAAHLRRQGARVLSQCSQLAQPVHSTYHRPDLRTHAAINLGNAVGADRVIFGFTKGEVMATDGGAKELALKRYDLQLKLTAIDLHSEKVIGTIETTASGFARSLTAAAENGTRLLLSDVLTRLPHVSPKQKTSTRKLVIELTGVSPKRLKTLLTSMPKARAIRSVSVVRMEQKKVSIQVTPSTARQEAERYLRKAGVSFTLLP